jgi:MFS family permease
MSAIVETLRRVGGPQGRDHIPSVVVGLGHGATHWISATLYILLPFIGADLGLSYTEIGSLVSLLYLASFCTNVVSGPLVDLIGRQIAFQAAALLIGGIALVGLGFSSSVLVLAGFVVLIGISISLWHPAAFTYLARRYPGARGFALSLHNLGASFGDTMAPLVAGFLLTMFAWNETALVASIPMFVMLALVLMLREPPGAAAPKPATKRRGDYVKGLAVLVRDGALLRLFLMSGLRSAVQNGLLVFLPLYLVGVLAASPATVGSTVMTLQIGGLIAGPLAGIWSDRVGRRPIAFAGLAATTALIAGVTLVPSTAGLIVLAGLTGFAIFAVRPVVHSWTVDLAADETSGSAVSLLFMAQVAITSLVPLAGGMIADRWGLETVFYILPLISLAAAAIALSMPAGKRRSAG